MIRGTAFAIALTLLAARGLAGDGVIEIHETCAYLTGCFPGDAPLLPVTIPTAGRFRLTSNLTVGGANVSAIEIAPGATVDMDLGGFAIEGIVNCVGIPATVCGPVGTGVGVDAGNDVNVHDGTVRGMGSHGVQLTWSARVENLHVLHNAGDGIHVGQASYLRGNQVSSNGGDGIDAGLEARVADNVIAGNGLAGIRATGGVVTENSSSRNGGAGGDFGAGVAFDGNSFSGNLGGSRVGGAATGGNVCDDGQCTRDGARRYYLTKSMFPGHQARTACAAGFHMASIGEFLTAGALSYDRVLGHATADQGSGPPISFQGWIRTGYVSTSAGTTMGEANCSAYASSAGSGSVAWLGPPLAAWTSSPVSIAPWSTVPTARLCTDLYQVWCLED